MKLKERPRRLRASQTIRDMVSETDLLPKHLGYPLFIAEGKGVDSRHAQVPGIRTLSVDKLAPCLKEDVTSKGIPLVVLFGVTSKKDAKGSEALNADGAVVRAIKEIRNIAPDVVVATDIALDPYTDHGHDGLFEKNKILNDATVEVLCQMSALHAKAGAQMVAPSDMMDGRIQAIRKALDVDSAEEVAILAYTAKYASALYGPFRETLAAQVQGDKKTYQMNPTNRREALRELEIDVREGADIVMVKPASWYLDVIADFKAKAAVPVAAYQVSGECAMIELGAKNGLFDRTRAMQESAVSIRRAGADLIVTYFAPELAALSL